MLGHKLPGMRSHYMKPDINTLLEGTKECKGYIAAIDSLTINDENRLKRENQELKEQDDYKDYLIQQRLKQKDMEIEINRKQIEALTEKVKNIDKIFEEYGLVDKKTNTKIFYYNNNISENDNNKKI